MLIDLDLTLVDSQIAAAVRKNRRWPAVYEMIPRFTPYDGVSELLVELTENDIGVCVVTSSPQSYCSRVLKHFDWKGNKTVCYHDTSRHKPDPDPLLQGLKLLKIQPQHAARIAVRFNVSLPSAPPAEQQSAEKTTHSQTCHQRQP